MSVRHLKGIEAALAAAGWDIQEKMSGDDHSIAEIWEIVSKKYPGLSIRLSFEGMDDLAVLPVEKSYACRVEGKENISLYFARSSRRWKTDLTVFIDALDRFRYETD